MSCVAIRLFQNSTIAWVWQIQVNATDADWITLSNGSLTAAALSDAPFDFSAALALNASGTGELSHFISLLPNFTLKF
jgi:hypothetical protein